MLAEVGEERPFLAERRHLRKDLKAEVAPLELTLAKVAPFGEGDGLAIMRAHSQRVAMYEVLRQDIESGPIEIIFLIQIQVLGENLQHIRATFSDIVGQEFNAVGAHEAQERILPLLKLGLSEFEFHRCQLPL
jgi:hypothetical protein